MSESQLDAIRQFRPFNQADVSMTRKFGGTGLGLAICKALVELPGGTIKIQAQQNVGSSFTFTVENHLESPEAGQAFRKERAAEKSKNGNVSNRSLGGLRVLLVEDGIDNQRLIQFIITKAGASVSLAESGQVAIEVVKAENDTFDLVLMDMQMPVMDGYTAAKRLREKGYAFPIIALTAHALAGAKEECLSVG